MGEKNIQSDFCRLLPVEKTKSTFSVVVPSVDDDDKINKIIAKRAIHAYAELEKNTVKNKKQGAQLKDCVPFLLFKNWRSP